MSNDGNQPLRFTGQLIAASRKAWLVDISDEEHWLPKSVCELDDPSADKGDMVSGTIPEWLVQKKGICLDEADLDASGHDAIDPYDDIPF